MRKGFFIIILFLFLTSSCAKDTSLTEYESKNFDESEIISAILEYQKAKEQFNLRKLLSFLHDHGQYTYGCRNMVSKKELKKLLPEFWKGLREGGRMFYPMTHECMNGDYFTTGRLVNPKINIDGNQAFVSLTFVNAIYKLQYYITLIKEKNCWIIFRLKWEDY